MDKMKILILTSSSPYINAGIVGLNLFNGLVERGHQAKMIVRQHDKHSNSNIVSLEKYRNVIIKKIKNKIRKIFGAKKSLDFIDMKYGIHDYDLTIQYFKTDDILKYVDFKPDVILYLFPQWFLNAENLYELNKITGAPIYWYLMDPAAITGGCHYFWECNNYLTGCGKCPGLNSNNKDDQSAINFRFKQKFTDKTDINIITGTSYDLKQTKESLMFKDKPIHKVFLPVDHNVFKPCDKKVVRNTLGLPHDKKILFFGAAYLPEDRKGMKLLTKALKIVKQNYKKNDVFLVIAGKGIEFIEDELEFDYKYVGNLQNNEELASAFQASDFFICPSIQDAGPFMINQSIMCGTPVVSFEIGVALDLIIPNETGFLAAKGSIKDLAIAILKALELDKDIINKMSYNSRSLGLDKLHTNVFVNKIENVFNTK